MTPQEFMNAYHPVPKTAAAASSMIANITDRNYIVGTLSDTGQMSIASNPVCHTHLDLAEKEAERLAKLNPGTAYVVMHFRVGKLTPKVVGVSSF